MLGGSLTTTGLGVTFQPLKNFVLFDCTDLENNYNNNRETCLTFTSGDVLILKLFY